MAPGARRGRSPRTSTVAVDALPVGATTGGPVTGGRAARPRLPDRRPGRCGRGRGGAGRLGAGPAPARRTDLRRRRCRLSRCRPPTWRSRSTASGWPTPWTASRRRRRAELRVRLGRHGRPRADLLRRPERGRRAGSAWRSYAAIVPRARTGPGSNGPDRGLRLRPGDAADALARSRRRGPTRTRRATAGEASPAAGAVDRRLRSRRASGSPGATVAPDALVVGAASTGRRVTPRRGRAAATGTPSREARGGARTGGATPDVTRSVTISSKFDYRE